MKSNVDVAVLYAAASMELTQLRAASAHNAHAS